MQVFKGKKTYEEYIRTIANGMTSDTFEFNNGFEHERGIKYLIEIKEPKVQNKIMKTLKCIDKDMTDFPRKDEMYKKLSYFLKVGILYGEYDDCIENLSPEAISTLITDNVFSFNDEMTRKYISILANDEFLLYLRNCYLPGQRDDIMLAITEHFDRKPFDTYDDKLVAEFQKNTILQLIDNKQKYIDEVPGFSEIAEEVWKHMK